MKEEGSAIIGSLKLTRSALEKLVEDDLRQKVLIPLFKQMGFKDVQHYHGGMGEKGKDIVMWKHDEIGERESFGVVVVREPLSSRADPRSGGGSAGKIAVQINQMFSNPYIDGVSGEKRGIDTCWVVTSKSIQKEAPDTILSSVSGVVPKQHIQFIAGERLWSLITTYFPLTKVREKIDEMLDAFQTLAPGCKVTFAADSRSRSIRITPERERLHHGDEIAALSFRPVFPDTPEGQKKRREFEEKIQFGRPLSIPLSQLADLRLPELAQLLVSDAESGELCFRARPETDVVQLAFEVFLDAGGIIRLPLVELKSIVSAESQTWLSNEHQPIAWKFEIKLADGRKDLTFSMSFRGLNANAFTLCQGLQFWSALSKPGLLVASSHNNGIALFMERTPFDVSKLMYDTPPTDQELRLFEALSQIQRQLGLEIFLPERDLTQDEIHDIFCVKEVITSGQRNFGRASFQCAFAAKSDADGLLGLDRKGTTVGGFQIVAPPQRYSIFENEIEVGPCFVKVGEAATRPISEENISQFDLGGRADFEVVFQCVENSVAIGYYPKWASADHPIPTEVKRWIEETIREVERDNEEDGNL